MDMINSTPQVLIAQDELRTIKEKTDQLMSNLDRNDFENALKCIHEINNINDKSMANIIGRLTRGLHDAINDLNTSLGSRSAKNKTRANLDYVIQLTNEAATKTLDITEQSMSYVKEMHAGAARRKALLDDYQATHSPDAELTGLLEKLRSATEQDQECHEELKSNITDIILAQNFHDLTTQSIKKATKIIKDVENSLISLTQYANLLRKLSTFSEKDPLSMSPEDKEELKSGIGRLNIIPESEHLEQDEVDDLLSSLGF